MSDRHGFRTSTRSPGKWFSHPSHRRREPDRGVEIKRLRVELVHVDLEPGHVPLARPVFAGRAESAANALSLPARSDHQIIDDCVLLRNEKR